MKIESGWLHHTYGVDPSMLEVALMECGRSLPQRLHDDYQAAYAAHRETQKVQVNGIHKYVMLERHII